MSLRSGFGSWKPIPEFGCINKFYGGLLELYGNS